MAYDYTSEGRVLYRYWMRGFDVSEPVWSHYEYDANTGELTDIHYFKGSQSDPDTPDVAFTYDRLGRQATVTDVVGTRTFAYRDNVSTDGDLQLETEDIVAGGGGLYSKLITRKYETAGTNQMPGRSSGFLIGHSGDPDADYEASYSYWNNARLSTVVGPGFGSTGARYEYTANSDLVTKTRYTVSVLTKASATVTYEPYRDLVASVENKRDASPAGTISKYAYVNDDLGRRTSVVMTGSAFTNYGDDHHWRWGYNDRSEVTSASWCSGTDLQAACDPAPLSSATYAYDPIGNRTVMTREIIPSPNVEVTVTTDYERNELNQYTSTADSSVYGPGCETEFEYDDDGNMSLADNTCLAPTAYAWDGENRLIRVEPAETPQTGDKKVEFAYDYMSRRVQKKVFVWDTGDWELETDHRFVYDQWNVVLVLDGLDDNAILTKYTWGLDLSGQRGNPTAAGIHGAGGIGGLLAVEETAAEGSPKYWFLHDANGNVAQVVQNTTNYPVVAHYEYDAYGNTITATGSYAAANSFRFSTKWRDAETGLYYYGHRYYDPRLGRWVNRDPIEEDGGLNLYMYLNNRVTDLIDAHGQRPIKIIFGAFINRRFGTWFYEPGSDVITGGWQYRGDNRDFGGGTFRAATEILVDPGKGGSGSAFSSVRGFTSGSTRRKWSLWNANYTYETKNTNVTTTYSISVDHPEVDHLVVSGSASYPFTTIPFTNINYGPSADFKLHVRAGCLNGRQMVTIVGTHNIYPDYEALVYDGPAVHQLYEYPTRYGDPTPVNLSLSTSIETYHSGALVYYVDNQP